MKAPNILYKISLNHPRWNHDYSEWARISKNFVQKFALGGWVRICSVCTVYTENRQTLNTDSFFRFTVQFARKRIFSTHPRTICRVQKPRVVVLLCAIHASSCGAIMLELWDDFAKSWDLERSVGARLSRWVDVWWSGGRRLCSPTVSSSLREISKYLQYF